MESNKTPSISLRNVTSRVELADAEKWVRVETSAMVEFFMELDVQIRVRHYKGPEGQVPAPTGEAANAPGANLKKHWYDLYFGNNLLQRFVLAVVDGGRVYMPVPKNNQIVKLDDAIAQIVTPDLKHYSEYMDKLGVLVVSG